MPPFGPVHTVDPQPGHTHTHTIVLLHGRGSTGPEFASELFESGLSTGATLPQHLPSWRWVFPSSPEIWSTAFEETMPAWFEAHSLSDPAARQDLQMDGLRDSVRYVARLLEEEVERLGGKWGVGEGGGRGAAGRVVLGGMSQGGAVALWTLLCAGEGDVARGLGGFVAASTWLPFAENLERCLGGEGRVKEGTAAGSDGQVSGADAFVEEMTVSERRALHQRGDSKYTHSVPVFLGHSADDAYVDVELGRQAASVLRKVGLEVSWKEYSGAEQEGHWLKEPEEFDDIVRLLATIAM